MSTCLYDDALLRKLQNWCSGTNVTITGVNETKRLFEVISDEHNDQPITLPLVALSRPGGYTIKNKQKQPITFNGFSVGKTLDKTVQLNAIPIDIKYQIDIYTRYFQECDEYARNFVFNIINYPKVEIEIPYENADLIHRGEIWLTSEVEDNSAIPEHIISGQFYRLTLSVNIDNAYLWDVKIRNNYKMVDSGLYLVDPPPDKTYVKEKLDIPETPST